MSLDTMHDLLVHELRDLLNAEGQVLKALPKLAEQATNKTLVAGLTRHVQQTKAHQQRLEECFELLEVSSQGKRCKGMEGLLAEASELAEEAQNDEVRDAAIIAGCQKVEHYEISGYGTARAFAMKLELAEVAAVLRETLMEESATNEALTAIAETEVNAVAVETDGEPAEAEEEAQPAKGTKSKASGRVTSSRKRTESSSRRQ